MVARRWRVVLGVLGEGECEPLTLDVNDLTPSQVLGRLLIPSEDNAVTERMARLPVRMSREGQPASASQAAHAVAR